jgi:hypothetical protein
MVYQLIENYSRVGEALTKRSNSSNTFKSNSPNQSLPHGGGLLASVPPLWSPA